MLLRKRLGASLRKRRRACGLSQGQLAKKARLSVKYIGEIERGEANVSVDALERLSEVLPWNPFEAPPSNPPPEGLREILLAEFALIRQFTSLQPGLEAAIAWVERLLALAAPQDVAHSDPTLMNDRAEGGSKKSGANSSQSDGLDHAALRV